ncbi:MULTISPECIES: hypothetical protein [Methylobacter]
MNALNPLVEALDRLNYVASCQQAVSDLLIPESDLHAVNRDRLAGLLAFLDVESQLAREQLGAVLKSGKIVNIRSVK